MPHLPAGEKLIFFCRLGEFMRHIRSLPGLFGGAALAMLIMFPAAADAGNAFTPEGKEAAIVGNYAAAMYDMAAFAAKIRPKLILAGYGSPKELAFDEYGGYGLERYNAITDAPKETDTRAIATRLWLFDPFPDVQELLLQGLVQKDLPSGTRMERFNGETEILLGALDSLVAGHSADPRKFVVFWRTGMSPGDSFAGDGQGERTEGFAKERAIAAFLLPRILRFCEEEAPPAHVASSIAKGMVPYVPWKGGHDSFPLRAEPDYKTLVERAVSTLKKHWEDKDFRRKAEEVLDCGMGTPRQRLGAISYMRDMRDVTDLLLTASIAGARDEWEICWGYTQTFSYGLDCGWRGNAAAHLGRWIDRQTRIATNGGSPENANGEAALAVRELKEAPEFTSVDKGERFWLLLESGSVLPEAWKEKRNSALDVLRGTLPGGLIWSGPLLLELGPAADQDGAILRWYAEHGADTESCVLMRSSAKPEELRRRLAAWHLTLWEDSEKRSAFVLTRPYTGSFFLAMLPGMRGKAASLFLSSGEKLWFKNKELRGDIWYEAQALRSEPLPGGNKAIILEISQDQFRKNNERFNEDLLVRAALKATTEYPREGKSPEDALDFMRREGVNLNESGIQAELGIEGMMDALSLLWRLEGVEASVRERGREILLGRSRLTFIERDTAVKRLLGEKE